MRAKLQPCWNCLTHCFCCLTTADGSISPIVTTTLLIDRTAPQVSASVSQQTIINVALIAIDTIAGIGWIGYGVDSGTWQAYTAPLAFAPVQTLTLDYQARDAAGNWSALYSALTGMAVCDRCISTWILPANCQSAGDWVE